MQTLLSETDDVLKYIGLRLTKIDTDWKNRGRLKDWSSSESVKFRRISPLLHVRRIQGVNGRTENFSAL